MKIRISQKIFIFYLLQNELKAWESFSFTPFHCKTQVFLLLVAAKFHLTAARKPKTESLKRQKNFKGQKWGM